MGNEANHPEGAAELRVLRDGEMEQGYRVLCDAFDWLQGRGIRQWTAPLPLAVYEGWQRKGENYGLFVGGDLAAVLSLVGEPIDDWPGVSDRPQVLWLQALATKGRMRGRNLGRLAMGKAMEVAAARSQSLYVLCVRGSGFLPGWYEGLGFEVLRREVREYPPAGKFDMVLMRWRCGSTSRGEDET